MNLIFLLVQHQFCFCFKLPHEETVGKANEIKSWFFENVNKIDKPQAGLTKKNREDTNYYYQE